MPNKEEKSSRDYDYVIKEMFIKGLGLKLIGENIQESFNDHDDNADETITMKYEKTEKYKKKSKW